MSRVITFSQHFPAHHPRKGEPTYFVEKIWKSFNVTVEGTTFYIPMLDNLDALNPLLSYAVISEFKSKIINYWNDQNEFKPKIHTIRAGSRWKAGDVFSPRIWLDKPYRSKQLIIAPDIEFKKVVPFTMDLNGVYSVDGKYTAGENEDRILAENDGLTDIDMFHWLMKDYNKPNEFIGQMLIYGEGNMPYLQQ